MTPTPYTENTLVQQTDQAIRLLPTAPSRLVMTDEDAIGANGGVD